MRSVFLLSLLTACGPISLGGGKEGVGSAGDVEALCAESTPAETTITVEFPEYDGSCPWEEDDNLEMENGYYTARVEATEALAMPADSVICDVSYDFQIDPDDVQMMRYDDHFVLNFVDVVLVSSAAEIVDFLPETDGLKTWDWAPVAGQEIAFDDSAWCLGEEEGRSSCTVPPTDTPGEIELDFDEDLIAELSYRAVSENRVDFTFVTIGDNDPDTDCGHEAFSFDVSVAYVEP